LRLAIDARSALSAERTGIGHYTRELIRHLPEVDPDTTYVAWYLNARRLLRPWRWGRRIFPRRPNLIERWSPIPGRVFGPMSALYDWPPLDRLLRFDVLLAPNFVPPPTRAAPVVITVHDLAFRRFPETAPMATRRWLTRLAGAVARAAAIIVPSAATKADLLDLYAVEAERVAVIRHGIDHQTFRPAGATEIERVRRRYGIDGPYLLFVGGLEARKNLPALLRAYATLPDGIRPSLVLAGSAVPWNPEASVALSEALLRLPPHVREGIALTGYVADPNRAALYTGAAALVFPSLYEGFGFPVLEAMACGTPVVTSNVSSLPEVAGPDAVLVDPRDVESIAHGLRRVLEEEELVRRLRAAGPVRASRFSWDQAARATARVLHRAASMKPGHGRTHW
jgi:glycosyltransferase involved in cell wall biosynthesis